MSQVDTNDGARTMVRSGPKAVSARSFSYLVGPLWGYALAGMTRYQNLYDDDGIALPGIRRYTRPYQEHILAHHCRPMTYREIITALA
jgi:hypothetical protein